MGFSRVWRRGCASVVVASSLLWSAQPLHAEPSATQKEAARGMMTRGRALRDKADFRGALEQFQAADAIMGVPTTGYELARAQVDVGQWVEARATLRRTMAMPATANEPEPFTEARHRSEELDAELDRRIGALRFVISGAAEGAAVELSVDGEDVPSPSLLLPFRVNPGRHHVRAVSGQRRVERDVDARERDTVEVVLVLPSQGAVLPIVAPARPAAAIVATAPSHPGAHLPALVYVGAGVAAAGVVVGSVTGILASTKAHDAKQGCVDQRCPPETWSDVDSARALATASSIGFAVGGAGIVTGVLALILAKPSGEPPVRAELAIGGGLSSVNVSGSF